MTTPDATIPQNRVVLLGASNLTRSLATAVEIVRKGRGGPCRFLIGCGHGRSYGVATSILCRQLSGIAECGLWEALSHQPRLPTFALLTDIGNDIMYGYSAEMIIAWVRQCIDRLVEQDARIVVTALPMKRLERLSPRTFLVFRSILFPTQRTPWERALTAARSLDTALRELAADRRIVLAEHDPRWYGFDPIHIRRRYWAEAYGRILASWLDPAMNEPPSPPLRQRLRLQLLAPQRWRICGIERRRPQPAARLNDGSTLALY